MNKNVKKFLLVLLVVVAFFIISNFIEIEPLSFCLGATYIMMLDIINIVMGDK